MTHLVDTSVWHKVGNYPRVRDAVDALYEGGAIFSTCAPVIAEYSFSARSSGELSEMLDDLNLLYQLDGLSVSQQVHVIQRALWSGGRMRAAGALDVVIAAHAIAADQELVTCDIDFLHIAQALNGAELNEQLRVIHISEQGQLTHA